MCNSKKAYATGRGIQPLGVRIGDIADFQVHTEDAGEGDLIAKVVGPGEWDSKWDAFQASHLF